MRAQGLANLDSKNAERDSFIPAQAGEPSERSPSTRRIGVYPRAGGGTG